MSKTPTLMILGLSFIVVGNICGITLLKLLTNISQWTPGSVTIAFLGTIGIILSGVLVGLGVMFTFVGFKD